jgi:serine/threonine protein kinase
VRFLSDEVVARLREVTEQPDLSGTRYRLIGEVGRGGMGVVYEAEDVELGRRVALKVLDMEVAEEARVIAGLEHPGIVPVHDSGVLPDGRVFYTMKLVRGERLDIWTRGSHGTTEVLRLFARICEAVAFAHANGVVHRDLKPENVMVGEFGAVLVMDWGVAWRAGESSNGVIAGTLGWMAPEQARGATADPRADVYALGAILLALLESTGERIPRRLRAIVSRAKNDAHEMRYRQAGELGDDVLRYLDSLPVNAYPENVFERTGRWLGKHRALVGMVLAYLIMRTIILLWARL